MKNIGSNAIKIIKLLLILIIAVSINYCIFLWGHPKNYFAFDKWMLIAIGIVVVLATSSVMDSGQLKINRIIPMLTLLAVTVLYFGLSLALLVTKFGS